ncbi:MAG: DUF1127 domain-containing protein [Rhodospirillales bacterium]
MTTIDEYRYRKSGLGELETWQLMAEARMLQSEELARLLGLATRFVAGFIRSYIWEPAARWHRRRSLYYELSGMDDHMLADIGIQRHEIKKLLANSYTTRLKTAAEPLDGNVVYLRDGETTGRTRPVKGQDEGRPLAA